MRRAALITLLAALSRSSGAQTVSPAPTPTATPTPTPTSKWGKLPTGCEAADADAVAASTSYASCKTDAKFVFDLAAGVTVAENAFCSSVNCLKVYRALKALDAVACANVKGLEAVQLTVSGNPAKCFGQDAADGKSDFIRRPGTSSSGSGSSGDAGSPTPTPPATTTKPPTTTAPPATTEPPTTEPPTPTPTTSAPTTTKPPHSSSGSGSGSPLSPVVTAPTTSNSNNSGSGKDSGSGMDAGTIVAIAGVSVGVVGVIGALIFVSTQQKKKRRRAKRSTTTGETATYQELASYYGDPTRPSGAQGGHPIPSGGYASDPVRPSGTFVGDPMRPSGTFVGTYTGGPVSSGWHSGSAGLSSVFVDWDEELLATVRVPYEKLTFDELISRGGYGEVYRGTYRGQRVAIKTLLPERRRDMHQIQSFLAEVKMMAGMEHERIVKLIGVAWDSLEELSVVTEFLDRGDLRTVLSGFEKSQTRPHGFDAVKVKIALHVAHGLTYMHTLQPLVLHRDLKSRNILLDRDLNAKITDFGVSRERSDRTMTAGVGSSLWMAPEVMMGERYDEKADIFSFGVVLSELDNHKLPYANAVEKGSGRRLPDAVVLQMVSLGRLRVSFTNEERSEMAKVGLKCVAMKPADRPTAAEVLYLIHQISRQN